MTQLKKALLLFLLILLPACSSAAPTPAAPSEAGLPTAEVEASSGYPVEEPGAAVPPAEAYPGPQAATDDPLAAYPETLLVPQPKAGLGVITGRILELANNEVYLAPTLILGELTYPNEAGAAPPLVGFSETSDPRGIQARTGKFMFQDIEPGTYAVVIWTPASSTLVTDRQGNTSIVEVKADQIVDMGDVFIP